MSRKKKIFFLTLFFIPILMIGAAFLGELMSPGLASPSEDNHNYLPLIINPAPATPTLEPTLGPTVGPTLGPSSFPQPTDIP